MRQQSHKKPRRLCGFIVVALALGSLPVDWVLAQGNYVAFELVREDNWEMELAFEDLNGDGLKDIVHSSYQTGVGRELHVYHQQNDGSFSSTAQRIEIKTEIIAVGFADLRPEPGLELLLLSSGGAFSLSTKQQGYAGNLKPLLEWELVAAVPDLETGHFLSDLQDLNGDGEIDLLLPGTESYGLFLGRGNEVFELKSTFSTNSEDLAAAQRSRSGNGLDARIAINAEEGVAIELTAESNSSFEGFLEQWDSESNTTRSLLRTENWMPSAIFAQLDGDGLVDIAYVNEGSDGLGRLNIHFQNADSGYNERADWTASLDTRGDIHLVDMDNDKILDFLRLSGEGNDRNAYIYRNRNGAFDFEKPDQVMRFSGYDVRVNIIELVPDSQPIMNVSFYTIPVVDAIRNASINRSQLIFGSDDVQGEQIFNRRPNSRLDESFSAANVRGLSEQMSLLFDVDGDGRKDALFITENGTIAAKRVNDSLGIESEPFWEYVSPRSVYQFHVMQLNQDGIPDLLLRHATATTLLVSAP